MLTDNKSVISLTPFNWQRRPYWANWQTRESHLHTGRISQQVRKASHLLADIVKSQANQGPNTDFGNLYFPFNIHVNDFESLLKDKWSFSSPSPTHRYKCSHLPLVQWIDKSQTNNFFLFLFFLFWDKVSLHSPGWLGTHYVGLELTEYACLCFCSARAKGLCNHAQRKWVLKQVIQSILGV